MEPSDVLYRVLIDHLPEGVLIVENDCLSFVNPTFARMLGYTVPELLRKGVHEIATQEDTFLVLGRERSREPGLSRHEVHLRHRDGKSLVHALLDIGAVQYSDKTVIIGIVRDISARKEPEECLRQTWDDLEETNCRRAVEIQSQAAKQLLKALMMMPALIALIRLSDSTILEVNQIFCDVIGLDRQEIIGRSVAELGILDCRLIHGLNVSYQVLEPFISEITPFRTHCGDGRYGLLFSHIVEIGDVPCVLIIIQDITEHRNAQQGLLEKDDALREKTKKLEEVNTAFKILLETRDEEKVSYEKQVQAAICDALLPHLKKMKSMGLDKGSREGFEQLENMLMNICSPYLKSLKVIHSFLTPREAEVVEMIRMGKKTKEIADALNVSPGTVETHRHRICKKLGLPAKKERLISHLRNLS